MYSYKKSQNNLSKVTNTAAHISRSQ